MILAPDINIQTYLLTYMFNLMILTTYTVMKKTL